MNRRVPILPYEASSKLPEEADDAEDDTWRELLDTGDHRFLPLGRRAIDDVLARMDLTDRDEVLITTSSGQTYIPSCVTCTVFNHAQPSRTVTSDTRAILVIHEYGVPHPRMDALADEASDRDIPLIEDCAHTMDSQRDGRLIGTWGDLTVYSLSKIFPVPSGGLLVGQNLPEIPLDPHDEKQARMAEEAFRRLGPSLSGLSRRRREAFHAVADAFPDSPRLFNLEDGTTPYMIGLEMATARTVRRVSDRVEWGSTLRDDLLLVPTNPCVDPDAIARAVTAAVEEAGDDHGRG